jgi:ArsR family transcriptional regulator, cadmium/lead-responsive transcriptional repressor
MPVKRELQRRGRRAVVVSAQGDMMAGMPESAFAAPFLLPEQPTEPDLVAKYFRVLSDVTRVRILELLAEREELSVGEIVARLGEPQPKVSNHLACLRWCGFVATRREHRTVHYRVADHRVTELLALGRALLSDNAEHVAACRRVQGSGGR